MAINSSFERTHYAAANAADVFSRLVPAVKPIRGGYRHRSKKAALAAYVERPIENIGTEEKKAVTETAAGLSSQEADKNEKTVKAAVIAYAVSSGEASQAEQENVAAARENKNTAAGAAASWQGNAEPAADKTNQVEEDEATENSAATDGTQAAAPIVEAAEQGGASARASEPEEATETASEKTSEKTSETAARPSENTTATGSVTEVSEANRSDATDAPAVGAAVRTATVRMAAESAVFLFSLAAATFSCSACEASPPLTA